MTEQELKIRKLELEIADLSTPRWKRPAYLTIIVSAITIIVSAIIGFSNYFSRVDDERAKQITDLQSTIERLEDERHFNEISSKNIELNRLKEQIKSLDAQKLKIEIEIQDSKLALILSNQELAQSRQRLADVKKEHEEYVENVTSILSKYKELAPKHGNRLISSASGQAKIKQIMMITDPNVQRVEIGKFAYGITNQTYSETLQEIKSELKLED